MDDVLDARTILPGVQVVMAYDHGALRLRLALLAGGYLSVVRIV